MAQIEIEEYKGQTIFYDDDNDKFYCDISIEDKFKNTKRSALKDVRKEIDSFIKENADFKPFKVFSTRWSSLSIISLDAIRTDGKFYSKEKRSIYDEKDIFDEEWRKWTAEKEAEYRVIQKELQDARDKHNKSIAAFKESLEPVDLSKYEHIIK